MISRHDRHHVYGPEDTDSFVSYTEKLIARNQTKAKGNFKVFYELCRADGIVIDDPDTFMACYFKKKTTRKKATSRLPYKKVHHGHEHYRITPAN